MQIFLQTRVQHQEQRVKLLRSADVTGMAALGLGCIRLRLLRVSHDALGASSSLTVFLYTSYLFISYN